MTSSPTSLLPLCFLFLSLVSSRQTASEVTGGCTGDVTYNSFLTGGRSAEDFAVHHTRVSCHHRAAPEFFQPVGFLQIKGAKRYHPKALRQGVLKADSSTQSSHPSDGLKLPDFMAKPPNPHNVSSTLKYPEGVDSPPPTYEDLQMLSAADNYFRSSQEIKNLGLEFDAIIVLSGGVDRQGRPSIVAQARLDAAGELKEHTKYFISTGGLSPLVRPALDERGFPVDEGRAGALYLMQNYNIPGSRIIVEAQAKDTIGNAFFSRLLCTDHLQLKRLLIVSSAFHMLRSKVIFDWAMQLPPVRDAVELYYLEAQNRGMDDYMRQIREKKEIQSVELFWNKQRRELKSVKDLANFVFFQHQAYSADPSQVVYDMKISAEARATYGDGVETEGGEVDKQYGDKAPESSSTTSTTTASKSELDISSSNSNSSSGSSSDNDALDETDDGDGMGAELS